MKFAVALAAIAALMGGASLWAQGPLPGDTALTLALQSAFSSGPGWAGWLTASAKAPILLGTIMLAAMLAWAVAGVRAAVSVPIAYALAFFADKALRAVLFVPRPDPALVAVAEPAASSGLPSTFGLMYGALFGAALLARPRGGKVIPVRLIAAGLLLAGCAARVVLAGHWASQITASTALGLALAKAALALALRLPITGRR